jgi:glycosyltransferase involved in cell wall biosynthesis
MRVVHWFPNYLAGGGVANSIASLASAQARAGLEVTIVSRSHGRAIYGDIVLDDAVRVETWHGTASLGRRRMSLHLAGRDDRTRLRQLEPDAVHVHAEYNPDNWWAPRLWQRPLILSPHGAFHAAVLDRRRRAKAAYWALANRLLYSRVDAFHALNPAEAADIRQAVPGAGIYCAVGGPSPGVERGPGPTAREPGDVAELVFLGRLDVAVKGLDLLVAALADAKPRLSRRVRVTLVGPDWHGGAGELSRLARQLGVADAVVVRGAVRSDEVVDVLAGADLYVQLSRNEGSPLSLNDALVLGKPVLASDRIGTVSDPEIASLPHVRITRPEVANASDALVDVVSRLPELARAAGAAQPDIARHLSWDRSAAAHANAYEACVRRRR